MQHLQYNLKTNKKMPKFHKLKVLRRIMFYVNYVMSKFGFQHEKIKNDFRPENSSNALSSVS